MGFCIKCKKLKLVEMQRSDFDKIFDEYKIKKREGTLYSLLETHSKWLESNINNGTLKAILLEVLKESYRSRDYPKYELVILLIQALKISFDPDDKHFDYLFLITDLLLDEFKANNQKYNAWILNQFGDICFHEPSENINSVIQRNKELVMQILWKFGTTKYKKSKYPTEMYLAVEKSINLLSYLGSDDLNKLVENVFSKHFDIRIIEEVEELCQHLKEDNRY